jgi:hypothetical protein
VKESTLFRQHDYSHPSRFDVIKPESVRETDIAVPWFDGQVVNLWVASHSFGGDIGEMALAVFGAEGQIELATP